MNSSKSFFGSAMSNELAKLSTVYRGLFFKPKTNGETTTSFSYTRKLIIIIIMRLRKLRLYI